MIPLQARANAAMAAIDDAKTPAQKAEALRDGHAVHSDLARHVADENFKAAFKAAKPQSMIGVWQDTTVRDHPIFMVGPAGTKITAPITLPDGSKAIPNPQYQMAVAGALVPEMLRRGFVRANSVFSDPGNPLRDPARPNNV